MGDTPPSLFLFYVILNPTQLPLPILPEHVRPAQSSLEPARGVTWVLWVRAGLCVAFLCLGDSVTNLRTILGASTLTTYPQEGAAVNGL